jgi:DNA-binding response OmpR family regulator
MDRKKGLGRQVGVMSKILVVEDEPSIVQLLEDYLGEEGYQTSHARSGEEALTVMAHQQPDLVLLDLRLPEMNGAEVCREMRQNPRLMGIPIIVLTSSPAPSKQRLVDQLGADDYVTKPFDLDELDQHIHAQLHYCEPQGVSELTGLPTGSAVVEAIEHCINHPEQPRVIIYVNIEHLDTYNQTYSFLEGNDLIQKAAAILREVVAKNGVQGDFLGHICGGEFIIITQPACAQAIIGEAHARFTQKIPEECYPAAICEQGYVMASGHDSQASHCPLAELSFDLVDSGLGA